MSIDNFITDLLNIRKDQIENIDTIKQSDGSFLIFITLTRDPHQKCPVCSGKTVVHDYRKRMLKHSILHDRKSFIVYRQRRYRCKECNNVFYEHNPFTSDSSRITIETKIDILKLLKDYHFTYSAVARLCNVPVQTVIRIFDKHVDIPRKALPAVLSIDEKYFPSSDQDGIYMCILMDFFSGQIVDILPDRKKDYLIRYFSSIRNNDITNNTKEMSNVKYVSIDMYDTYKEIAKAFFPEAVICADSFHVLENLTKAFNNVRTRCRRETKDETMEYLLYKFRYIFKHNINLDNTAKYNKRLGRFINYRGIMELLFDRFPDLKAAYELKEAYIYFNSSATRETAEDGLNNMIRKFADCNIPEYVDFYNLLVNWHIEIINSFTVYNGKRINNSSIESRNKMIETLFFNANGFVNFRRTRNRILYCLNKNDMYKI